LSSNNSQRLAVVPSGSEVAYSAVPPNWCFHLSTSLANSSLAFAVLVSVLPVAMTRPASPLPLQSACAGEIANRGTSSAAAAARFDTRMGDRSRILLFRSGLYAAPHLKDPRPTDSGPWGLREYLQLARDRCNFCRVGQAGLDQGIANAEKRQELHLLHVAAAAVRLQQRRIDRCKPCVAQQAHELAPDERIRSATLDRLHEQLAVAIERRARRVAELAVVVDLFDDQHAAGPQRLARTGQQLLRVGHIDEHEADVDQRSIACRPGVEQVDRVELDIVDSLVSGALTREPDLHCVRVETDRATGRTGAGRQFERHIAAAEAGIDQQTVLQRLETIEQRSRRREQNAGDDGKPCTVRFAPTNDVCVQRVGRSDIHGRSTLVNATPPSSVNSAIGNTWPTSKCCNSPEGQKTNTARPPQAPAAAPSAAPRRPVATATARRNVTAKIASVLALTIVPMKMQRSPQGEIDTPV